MSEEPAGTLAERAKLAASLNNQERVGWDCPTRSTAALATANWQPYQNFALPEAYGTRTVFHWLTGTESASLWRIRRHSGPTGSRALFEDAMMKLRTFCDLLFSAYNQSIEDRFEERQHDRRWLMGRMLRCNLWCGHKSDNRARIYSVICRE